MAKRKYEWIPPGKAKPAKPMHLTEAQRREVDAWLLGSCTGLLRPHTATYMANHVAPMLGYADGPLDYDVLHPLCATLRIVCRYLGVPVRSLARDDEGSQPRNLAQAHEFSLHRVRAIRRNCNVCGAEFVDTTGYRRRCDACHAAKLCALPPKRPCKRCGTLFQPTAPNGQYCSYACKRAAKTEKERMYRAQKKAENAQEAV